MFFLNWPASLWFLRGGGPTGSSAQVCVSAVYKITASAGEITSVNLELSSFAYYISAVDLTEPADDHVTAGINANDSSYSGLEAKLTAIPVFVLQQTGSNDVSTSVSYKLTASATGSIFVNVVPSVTYLVTASTSAGVLIADIVSVSSSFKLTASTAFVLQTQIDPQFPAVTSNYQISASSNVSLAKDSGGGLVWSKKLGRYVAVRIGSTTPFT